jgi:hypothetical protein
MLMRYRSIKTGTIVTGTSIMKHGSGMNDGSVYNGNALTKSTCVGKESTGTLTTAVVIRRG